MHKIFFTSNFNKLPIAFILGVICIFFIEFIGHKVLVNRVFSHEVDHVLHKVEHNSYNAKYLLIGDSVGSQLFNQFNKDPQFAVLATNQAIELTGQYFLLQRYLNKNIPPTAVLFATSPYFDQNLEQNYTENFVFRPFNKLEEVWEVFKVKKDPAISLKMIIYGYFPSFKYRLQLQKLITGFANSDIYSGLDSARKKPDNDEYSILQILKKTFAKDKASHVHFEKLVALLSQNNIDFYYIPTPVEKPPKNKRSWAAIQHQKLLVSDLPRLKQLYPETFYYEPDLIMHESDLFRDHAHYNAKGLSVGEDYMRDKVDSIMRKYSIE